ncbi:MAG: hypothetical protein F6J90_26235 [Moorea sp. SIOASIH]|uniref:hypothetical protein n=1 Tax=Moorena sp. SIOASIH TaxID=2607817 RepID=UPI0013B95E05|nr:hypothetical protein [Moorena sp. SIOASIH]NEO39640.1 hypothetical protein [Moorena sp. SIOASIH]
MGKKGLTVGQATRCSFGAATRSHSANPLSHLPSCRVGSAADRFTKLAIALVSTAHQRINHNGSRCRVGRVADRFTKLAIALVSTDHQTINHNGSRCRVGSAADRFTKLVIALLSTAHPRINHNGRRSQLNGEEEQGKDKPDQGDFN